MSNEPYPHLGSRHRTTKWEGICVICGGNKSSCGFVVKYSLFRGDEKYYYAHYDCMNGKRDCELLDYATKSTTEEQDNES